MSSTFVAKARRESYAVMFHGRGYRFADATGRRDPFGRSALLAVENDRGETLGFILNSGEGFGAICADEVRATRGYRLVATVDQALEVIAAG